MPYDDEDDVGFRPVVRGWPALAYIAWEGYQLHGPGVVYLLEKQDDPWVGEVYYTPVEALDGTPDDDFKESLMLALLSYEPTEQIVLVLVNSERVARVMTLSGELTPPEAYSERVLH